MSAAVIVHISHQRFPEAKHRIQDASSEAHPLRAHFPAQLSASFGPHVYLVTLLPCDILSDALKCLLCISTVCVAHTCAYTHTNMHTHSYTRTRALTPVYTPIRTRAHIRTHAHITHRHTCTHMAHGVGSDHTQHRTHLRAFLAPVSTASAGPTPALVFPGLSPLPPWSTSQDLRVPYCKPRSPFLGSVFTFSRSVGSFHPGVFLEL